MCYWAIMVRPRAKNKKKQMPRLKIESFQLYALKGADEAPPDTPKQMPNYLAMLMHPNMPPRCLDLKIGAICTI